jgi:hypothetical protein
MIGKSLYLYHIREYLPVFFHCVIGLAVAVFAVLIPIFCKVTGA